MLVDRGKVRSVMRVQLLLRRVSSHVGPLLVLLGCSPENPSHGVTSDPHGNLVLIDNAEDEFPLPRAGGLAPTPPMGWNSWNEYSANINAAIVMKAADILVSSGMRDAGYLYVNIDDGWAKRMRTPADETETGADSVIEADPVKFPPADDGTPGIRVVADYVHSLGLKLGIYSDRGSATCGGFAASGGYETIDAQTFADWGVDYVKYDNCNADDDAGVRQQQYRAMGEALSRAGRPIVFSICSWQFDEWNADAGQLWRTTGDITSVFNDVSAVTPPSRTIVQNMQGNLPYAAYAGPNAWNDPDMLEVGNLPGAIGDVESRTHFNLWAMMAAPLIAGNQLDKMTETTRRTLTNPDLIAVDQDELGIQGVPVKTTESTMVWAKPLNEAGARAVLFVNAGSTPTTVSVTLPEVGLGGTSATLRDLWMEGDGGVPTGSSFSAEVPPHGSMMYRVTGQEPGVPNGVAYLSDLTWTYAANAFGPVERDMTSGGRSASDGEPIVLGEQSFSKGLGVAAGSKLIYRLARRCSSFHAVAGAESGQSAATLRFEVWADGERLYPEPDAPSVTAADPPATIDVELTGKSRLTLLVTNAGDEVGSDRAVWADAQIRCSP